MKARRSCVSLPIAQKRGCLALLRRSATLATGRVRWNDGLQGVQQLVAAKIGEGNATGEDQHGGKPMGSSSRRV